MPKSEDLSRSLEINAIWTFDTEFPTIFNKSCTYITFKSAVKHRQLGYGYMSTQPQIYTESTPESTLEQTNRILTSLHGETKTITSFDSTVRNNTQITWLLKMTIQKYTQWIITEAPIISFVIHEYYLYIICVYKKTYFSYNIWHSMTIKLPYNIWTTIDIWNYSCLINITLCMIKCVCFWMYVYVYIRPFCQ